MHPFHDRLQGVLFGLAAGDRIGGPIRMALQLAQSLVDKQAFEPEDVLSRYVLWWQQEGFDTGPTADSVFELMTNGTSAQEAVHQVHILFNRMTAGCNPAHRSAPLAMAGFLSDDELSKATHTESALTHFDPLAGEVAAAAVMLCRLLIRGVEWQQALNQTVSAKTRQYIEESSLITLNRGGFAPDVLLATLYFVHQHTDFETALAASITFAGGANYCPVLVGAIGGARWGRTQIPNASLHHALPLLPEIQLLTDALASSFPSTN